MNIGKINTELIEFWNDFFKEHKPMTLDKKDMKVEHELDQYIKDVGDYASTILDLGTGSGYCILTAALLGSKMTHGLAIDPSLKAIETLNETLKNSNINTIETKVGTHVILDSYEDGSFDGVLSSNVLDVVPYETSEQMIEEIKRLLKPKGLLMLKLNFYLTEDMIKRTKAVRMAHNTYAINGVLRSHNLTTEEWVRRFNGFRLLKSATYERIENGPLDRVLLLEKIS
ncbi:MAG: class I SAM-dependent methyltransferase [Candidatus Izemoplasmataceae bacterium]